MYCFFAAFRYDSEDHDFTDFESIGLSEESVKNLDLLDLIFEIFYIIDFLIQFLVEYEAKEPSTHIVREISKTATRYYKNEMIYDMIPLFPFNRFFQFKYSRLFYFIKCIRLIKCMNLLDTQLFMKNVQGISHTRLLKICQDPNKANDTLNDHN
jgi:hypothetical protein